MFAGQRRHGTKHPGARYPQSEIKGLIFGQQIKGRPYEIYEGEGQQIIGKPNGLSHEWKAPVGLWSEVLGENRGQMI